MLQMTSPTKKRNAENELQVEKVEVAPRVERQKLSKTICQAGIGIFS